MSAEWRLLYDGIFDAHHHFALEEALARLVDEGRSPPTLRMRRVQPAVFVGVYQHTLSEVNAAYCQAHGIQIVRRPNGGGAVYQEMGSFCFSAFFRRDFFPQRDEELYRLFALPAVRTCADYGVSARFTGRNDVQVGERKIYGSAQLSWYDTFVQSGTFLVNMDFDAMAQALTPPAEKFAGKSTRSVQQRVTSLALETGRQLDTREVMECFAAHAAEALDVRLVPGGLSAEEQTLAGELLAVKYGTDDWNFGTRGSYQVTVAERAEAGVISLSVDMKGGKMTRARLSGDFLLPNSRVIEELEHALAGRPLQEAQTVLQKAAVPDNFRLTLIRLLEKLSREINERS